MGYTTDFFGRIEITPALDSVSVDYINVFNETRRMRRSVRALSSVDPEGVRGKFGTSEYGEEGEFYAYDDGEMGQSRDNSIIDYNSPPPSQPGLWCGWKITNCDGKQYIEWDGCEKFYHYIEWMEYVINNFIAPKGSTCNGRIVWQGEEDGDVGNIIIANNNVTINTAR